MISVNSDKVNEQELLKKENALLDKIHLGLLTYEEAALILDNWIKDHTS